MPVLPSLFFFFNDTATTEIYTLSLHDALPISRSRRRRGRGRRGTPPASSRTRSPTRPGGRSRGSRSEEHTSELQSPCNLVCRLLLEKKKRNSRTTRQRRAAPPAEIVPTDAVPD